MRYALAHSGAWRQLLFKLPYFFPKHRLGQAHCHHLHAPIKPPLPILNAFNGAHQIAHDGLAIGFVGFLHGRAELCFFQT